MSANTGSASEAPRRAPRLLRGIVIALAILVGPILVAGGWYASLELSEPMGHAITALGFAALLLALTALVLAIAIGGKRSGQGRAMLNMARVLAILMVIPALGCLAWASGGDSRNAKRIDDFQPGFSSSRVTDLDKPIFESQSAVRAFSVPGDFDTNCTAIRKAFAQWWGQESTNLLGSESECRMEAAGSGREADAVFKNGRLVIRIWTKTTDLFVF